VHNANNVNGECIKYLSDLPISFLSFVNDPKLTDANLLPIAKLKSLGVLEIVACPLFKGTGIAGFAGPINLHWVPPEDMKYSNEALNHLSKFSFSCLFLNRDKLEDQQFDMLAKFSTVPYFALEGTKRLTSREISCLLKIPSLNQLQLSGIKFDVAGLSNWHGTGLILHRTGLNDNEVKVLSKLKLAHLELWEPKLTKASLASIAKMRTLTSLHFRRLPPAISIADLQALRKSAPNLAIQWNLNDVDPPRVI
jgi:hypothetical protein